MAKIDLQSDKFDGEERIMLGLLNAVHDNESLSQRSLARELSIALGLTNTYLKRCIKKGLIKVRQAPANRYAYYLTPHGFTEKTRLTAEYLTQSLGLFRAARNEAAKIYQECLGKDWRRVVLVGEGDLAEIFAMSAPEGLTQLAIFCELAAEPDNLLGIRRLQHIEEIATFDPHGMYGVRPTISATTATMDIPEIKDNIVVDGKIVCDDKTVRCTKIGIEPVWNIPMIARRIGVEESVFRTNLYSVYKDPKIMTHDIFLPPVGGSTVYLIGELGEGKSITSRVHDECNGSDVFGTDICTCRPYLTFSIEEAVRTAQAGGCGVICYNRKEGRSLGEAIKFLVYNSREIQSGGDRADTYFDQTTAIAGVPDARMQCLMPDVFLWLGISRLDNWVSMSNDKSGAIRDLGIEIVNQYEIPKHMIPKRAHVEIDAKIQAGYFSSDK